VARRRVGLRRGAGRGHAVVERAIAAVGLPTSPPRRRRLRRRLVDAVGGDRASAFSRALAVSPRSPLWLGAPEPSFGAGCHFMPDHEAMRVPPA
jgi:hypothetical protein